MVGYEKLQTFSRKAEQFVTITERNCIIIHCFIAGFSKRQLSKTNNQKTDEMYNRELLSILPDIIMIIDNEELLQRVIELLKSLLHSKKQSLTIPSLRTIGIILTGNEKITQSYFENWNLKIFQPIDNRIKKLQEEKQYYNQIFKVFKFFYNIVLILYAKQIINGFASQKIDCQKLKKKLLIQYLIQQFMQKQKFSIILLYLMGLLKNYLYFQMYMIKLLFKLDQKELKNCQKELIILIIISQEQKQIIILQINILDSNIISKVDLVKPSLLRNL
ncbi:unnamed protein product [Paramecium sonneborni]|uniref:Uncharacterized protein n=1 Tax=Paramecium sonneborni TaxID=65129 RepID=A0A8S1RP74_9CILI|nr:unnamed protein product [Paramecium sonneborni]